MSVKDNQVTHEVAGVNFSGRVIPPINGEGEPFLIMETLVTQELYQAVMGENPSWFKDRADNAQRPVEYLRWNDAVLFANALSTAMGLQPAYVYDPTLGRQFYINNEPLPPEGAVSGFRDTDGWRLPFEAEWEWAAKGGEDHEYAGSDNLDEVGWYWGNSRCETHPVAQLKANGYGCYDFSGNVWEWCADDVNNPGKHRPEAAGRVLRGGYWNYDADRCRVSFRIDLHPEARASYAGLRLCRSL